MRESTGDVRLTGMRATEKHNHLFYARVTVVGYVGIDSYEGQCWDNHVRKTI